jgi:hypothetical protein
LLVHLLGIAGFSLTLSSAQLSRQDGDGSLSSSTADRAVQLQRQIDAAIASRAPATIELSGTYRPSIGAACSSSAAQAS